MRFQTVADVLNVVKEFHASLARQFQELEQLTTSERAQLMLDYLNRHEQNLARTTQQFADDTNPGLLHTWLQFAPETHPETLLEKVRTVDLNDVDSIVAVALEVDDYLIDLYGMVVDHADTDEVKEVFQSFIKLEDNERHTVARAAFRLSDI
jgi:flagellar motor component MotA